MKGLSAYKRILYAHPKDADPRNAVPHFMETLGLKAAQELLENNGNARSVIATNDSIRTYGELLFSMRYAKPHIFKGEQRYPINAAECHDVAIKSMDVQYDALDILMQKALGEKYEPEKFDRSREQREIEDAIMKIIHASAQVQAIARGDVGIVNGELVSTKNHPRIGPRTDNPRIANIPTGTSRD